MKTKLIWGNFSVQNAQRTRQFYTQLGFKPNGPHNKATLASFLFGENDFVIHFFEQGSQIDEYLPPGASGEIIFTLSAESEAEVNEWAERVEHAGGHIYKAVSRDENNYYGFAFSDPDGHRFNVLLLEKGM